MHVRLTKYFSFEAAQTLPKVPADHKCGRMHGHSFGLEVVVTGEVESKTGLFYDHGKLAEAVRPILEKLDHSCLNEIPGLENPTLELMAKWFWDRLAPKLPGLSEITLHETARASCTYRGD
jgi:6-pyruvoyltetrahydropterin/6-carboxytetrahydropterin synthase